jgi:MSHA pilin protein MshA
MYKAQKGFTLIELVVVIVLLGILGVTALGKFQDLSTDAQTAANGGVASELSAASSINYAARVLNPLAVGSTDLSGGAVGCAADVGTLFAAGYPAGYNITGGPIDCSTSGTAFTCNVIAVGPPTGVAATASLICTP